RQYDGGLATRGSKVESASSSFLAAEHECAGAGSPKGVYTNNRGKHKDKLAEEQGSSFPPIKNSASSRRDPNASSTTPTDKTQVVEVPLRGGQVNMA
ncbi:unnamed protein product, partial [Amoebophrya sp. A25]